MPTDDPAGLAILSDVNHPEHTAWQRGDAATVAKVEAAFRQKYGSEESTEPATTKDEPLDPELEAIKRKYESQHSEQGEHDDAEDQPPAAPSDPYEFAPHQTERALREEWQDDFERKLHHMNYCNEKVLSAFTNQKFVQEIFNIFGNHPEGGKARVIHWRAY